MKDSKERQAIKNAYPKSDVWHKKVNKMTEDQVAAIYLRLKRIGKI